MLLQQENFLTEEKESPFLLHNRGWLEKQNVKQIIERTQKWLRFLEEEEKPDSFSVPRDKHQEEKDEKRKEEERPNDEGVRRIVVLDAERTFLSPSRRKELSEFLYHIATSFGNYHQALSYVSAFLFLTFPKETVFKILEKLNSKHLPKYWQERAVGMGTDAYVLQELAQKFHPEVASHLSKNCIFPETYCPKWFCGLCTQILPIQDLFDFFEKFLDSPSIFLFQFSLSFFNETKSSLLKANDPTTLFTILRLDPSFLNKPENQNLVQNILNNAKNFDLSDVDFEEKRVRLYNQHLKSRLESNTRPVQDEDEDDDDLFGSDEEDDQSCQICDNLQPDVYCSVCKLLICEICHRKGKKDHKKDHSVTSIDDLSEELKKTLNIS